MKDEMPNIDTSGIETLKELKAEQDIYKERLDKMSAMKEKVSEQIFQKVQGDYTEKLDALQAEAEPLKNKIRGQYAVLKEILDGIQTELASLELEKEELEFRHTLGEFEEDTFKDQTEKWNVKHMEKQAETEELENLKAEFLSAFDSPDDLEITPAPMPSLETVPVTPRSPEPPQPMVIEEEAEAIADDLADEVAEELEETEDFGSTHDDVAEVVEEEEPEIVPPVFAEPEAVPAVEDELEDFSLEGDETETTLKPMTPPEIEPMELGEDLETDTEDIEPVEDADELTDEFEVDMSDTDLGDLEELETELEETGDASIEPPPLPDAALDTQPSQPPVGMDGTMKDMEPPAFEPDGTLLADRISPTKEGGDDDPEGTMIISNPKVISLNNATEGQVIVLGMGTTSVGRAPENDLHLTEDRVSRKHAQIAFGPGGYSIYDLNSENGTFVNGNRIREHFLSNGDIISIGTFKFLYQDR